MSDLLPHLHRSDDIPIGPLTDETGCLDCHLPGGHPIHTLPDTHQAQAEHRRRAGKDET